MPLITTPAVILHAFKYGESSKIVRMMTRDHGVQSAIAKGALRPRSKFGARLQVLSEGTAHMYMKQNRELHTLAEFEVAAQHADLAGDVKRFAGGVALAELIMRCAPAEPHPEIYELMLTGLDHLATAPAEQLDTATLSLLWATVGALGFTPTLDVCARDGRVLPKEAVTFSVTDGGFLCAGCARGTTRGKLHVDDRRALEALVAGVNGAVAPDNVKRTRLLRRIFVRFVERHVAEGRELRALSFWAGLK